MTVRSVADDQDVPFSSRLREATRVEHEAAEDSPFMRALLAGDGSPAWYAGLATQLWFVYSALESAARALHGDPHAGPFLAAGLERLPSLEGDLTAMLGARWRAEAAELPATAAYTARIGEVAERAPHSYVAHHYTRYLGDLSGGRILARVLGRRYGLGPQCLTFFEFPGIPRPKVFKDGYRARLDALGSRLSAEERDDVVTEARAAFDHNRRVFAGLGARLLPPAA